MLSAVKLAVSRSARVVGRKRQPKSKSTILIGTAITRAKRIPCLWRVRAVPFLTCGRNPSNLKTGRDESPSCVRQQSLLGRGLSVGRTKLARIRSSGYSRVRPSHPTLGVGSPLGFRRNCHTRLKASCTVAVLASSQVTIIVCLSGATVYVVPSAFSTRRPAPQRESAAPSTNGISGCLKRNYSNCRWIADWRKIGERKSLNCIESSSYKPCVGCGAVRGSVHNV